MKTHIIGAIPARYASQRFPGKMLAMIAGKPLLQHTYENARKFTCLDQLIVAVDHPKTQQLVEGLGGRAIMTSPTCANGSERIVEALADHQLADEAIVINIQGDEPMLPESLCIQLIDALQSDPEAVMATPVSPIAEDENPSDPNLVKCVFDSRGNALYFSRLPIPSTQLGHSTRPLFKHIGLYAYRWGFLQRYAHLAPTPLQLSENLEQLRILEHGYRIKVVEVEEGCLGVNEPRDILHIERKLCRKNTSSSPAESVPH